MLPVKNITIQEYDPNWINIFNVEASAIQKALLDNLINVHHIGSTSIDGLFSKPIIDIIAVVKTLVDHNQEGGIMPIASHSSIMIIKSLEKIGYVYKGEYNIPMRFYFNKEGVNLHLYQEHHPEIELNLTFRDYLRNHNNIKQEYSALKENLLKDPANYQKNNSSFTGYNLGKNAFINKVLNDAGFNNLRLLKCAHYAEWDAYHRIRKEQIFTPINIVYDLNHPTITAENHLHLILCQGTYVVSVAHLEFLEDDAVALRSLATDKKHQKLGFGKFMMGKLEEWLKHQGKSVIKLHARPSSVDFYIKLGYQPMDFNDLSIQSNYINLGKLL